MWHSETILHAHVLELQQVHRISYVKTSHMTSCEHSLFYQNCCQHLESTNSPFGKFWLKHISVLFVHKANYQQFNQQQKQNNYQLWLLVIHTCTRVLLLPLNLCNKQNYQLWMQLVRHTNTQCTRVLLLPLNLCIHQKTATELQYLYQPECHTDICFNISTCALLSIIVVLLSGHIQLP